MQANQEQSQPNDHAQYTNIRTLPTEKHRADRRPCSKVAESWRRSTSVPTKDTFRALWHPSPFHHVPRKTWQHRRTNTRSPKNISTVIGDAKVHQRAVQLGRIQRTDHIQQGGIGMFVRYHGVAKPRYSLVSYLTGSQNEIRRESESRSWCLTKIRACIRAHVRAVRFLPTFRLRDEGAKVDAIARKNSPNPYAHVRAACQILLPTTFFQRGFVGVSSWAKFFSTASLFTFRFEYWRLAHRPRSLSAGRKWEVRANFQRKSDEVYPWECARRGYRRRGWRVEGASPEWTRAPRRPDGRTAACVRDTRKIWWIRLCEDAAKLQHIIANVPGNMGPTFPLSVVVIA